MSARDANSSQGFKTTDQQLGRDWETDDTYWRDNWESRPYTSADRDYEFYRPGFRYGYESARSNSGRQWNDIESDLRSGWERYEHRGQTAWENIKEAVKDAWNRVANR